ncbi:class I SAM-dependent methyltransferase [aff. Roholtiella sp. LEGE 12411]|uniref:class I SAM-dependent methyltransferase n=1 Tax=aff. Roholtiella sp. LEGE 12411 TaxID=1828822 RepID=UPI0018816115|nr:methyltransferase domain-containing protein [aff. Roholtiella sp. LEGE 12411]MBE9033796.1 methyltransferase domain-containing protein [aff. Roholtiella sp. LEGE 12411]
MQIPTNQYEFSYTDTAAGHHHAYLLSPLLELISQQTITSTEKLKILDLGCGNGSLSQKIAQQGYEVVGVEDSASGALFARQNVLECHFIQASIYDLSAYTELESAFDVVVAAEVIEHLLYPRELLRSAKKCLKPGGSLILTTPYNGYWKNLVRALLGKTDQHYTALWDGGHVKFFSVATLSQLLQEEGFGQINFKFAGRFPYLWKSMLCSSFVTRN